MPFLVVILIFSILGALASDKPKTGFLEEGVYYFDDKITQLTYRSLATEIKSGKIHTLRLSSLGGYVEEAMLLGDLVQRFGITTYVSERDNCNSACLYIFVGGKHRVMEGNIGIHESSWDGTPYSKAIGPYRRALLRLKNKQKFFVEKYGVSGNIIEESYKVNTKSMKYIDQNEWLTYLQGDYK